MIHDCNDLGLAKSTLEAFIQQCLRMDSAHRLQRFEISFGNLWIEQQFEGLLSEPEIQFYLSQGLHISVLYNQTSWEPDLPSPWTGLTSPDDV